MGSIFNLRGLALSKYKTITDLANALGWKRNKVSRILNGLQEPNAEEIIQLASALEINSQDVFIQIFFAPMSTKWTN